MNATKYKFKFTDELAAEFDLLIDAYFGRADIQTSIYFDEERLLPFIQSLLIKA